MARVVGLPISFDDRIIELFYHERDIADCRCYECGAAIGCQ